MSNDYIDISHFLCFHSGTANVVTATGHCQSEISLAKRDDFPQAPRILSAALSAVLDFKHVLLTP
jgi:hypothetical protein